MKSKLKVLEKDAYVLIGYEHYGDGCLECVAKRMASNGLGGGRTTLNLTHFDRQMIVTAKKALEQLPANSYFLYNRLRHTLMAFQLIPYPMCSCQGRNAARHLSSDKPVGCVNFRKDTLEHVAARVEQMRSSLLHPIVGVFKNHYRSTSDCMPMIALEGHLGKRDFDAYGRQSTYRKAYYTALLEGLERTHGIAPQYSDARFSSEKALGKTPHLSLNQWLYYSEAAYDQPAFELSRYTEETVIPWHRVQCLNTHQTYWVPEECIYFSSEAVRFHERHLYESSNGMALGSTTEEALLSGLLEVVERDSFLVHWYLEKAPVRLERVDLLNHMNINMMLAYLKHFGYRTHIFDITLESKIPSVWVLLECLDYNAEDKLCFYTAGGADFVLENAIESALVEAATSIKVYNRHLKKKFKGKNIADYLNNYEKVTHLEDHIFLYSSKAMRPALAFALDTPHSAEAVTRKHYYDAHHAENLTQTALVETVVQRLAPQHPAVLYKDLSSKWLNDMGLSCVKVMIPSMQNIAFGHQYRNVNRQRLLQVENTASFNTVPHPFP